MSYKYQLDPSSKKFMCPKCNQKRFVRYIDLTSGNYANEIYGRCDREVKCAYHLQPDGDIVLNSTFTHKPQLPTFYVPENLFQKTLSNYEHNNLYLFLDRLFDSQKLIKLMCLYRIGTSKKWPGACIFWQISSQGVIGQGKIMLLDSHTGKRVKHPFPHITSVHKQLSKEEQKPDLLLFGEHLLALFPNKAIAVVESEKTAITMTGFHSKFNWVATGGLSNINSKRLVPFKSKTIVFYPDLGCYDKWKLKAENLNKIGFNISVSDLLENKATEEDKHEGYDIADYFIKNKLEPLEESETLSLFKQKNKAVQLFIDNFCLLEIKKR